MQSVDIYEANADDNLAVEQFVLKHQLLVKKIALFIKRRLPSHIELDDLLQSGLIGLLEARSHYKSNMGTTFETFASIRIRGAIIDLLRKNSWVSRDTLKNMRKVADAINKIEQRNQSQASMEEIVSELDITIEEYFKITQDISICHVLSLESVDHENSLLGEDDTNPEGISQNDSIKGRLQEYLKKLPEREQMVLSLYYVEEFTFKQIGEILDLTEARICQLHSQAIARVRAKLQD